MKKKITYVFLALFVITGNLGLAYYHFGNFNKWRMNRSNSLYNSSQLAKSEGEKLILLLQSDLLVPSEDKKLKIADLYLFFNNYKAAESVLGMVNSQSGYLKYAEAALIEGDLESANIQISKVSDENIRAELLIYSDIVQGKDNLDRLKELSANPRTDLGALLKAINNRDYTIINGDGFVGGEIKAAAEQNNGIIKTELRVSEILIGHNQYILARYILDRLSGDHPYLIESYVLKAKSYGEQGKYTEALKAQLEAVNINPANIDILQTALNYAKKANDETEISWIEEKISYLKKIQSRSYCNNCRP